MPPQEPKKHIDITRLNRAERRKMMRGGKMGYMIPGRNLPFVKKFHGEISNFYLLRDKEIKEEQEARAKQQIKNAAAISSSSFSTTAVPDKPLVDKATL